MNNLKETIRRNLLQGDLWLVMGVFGVVMLLILPISPFFLDVLLAFNIALSLLIFLVILYLRNPSDFTGFPTLLLCITLFRLGLNVASTRLILLDGSAGQIIETFGNFVVRGNYVVGLIIFAILILINFVVITKGAGRIAEVAARFTLDAMPGKQMAIDAELNAGMIDEKEARERRRGVEQEADFYGAMDGASKFVRGDAIAAVLITLINIVGGFAIGVFQMKMEAGDAVQRFTLLSIGDSLVSQIPSLITSTAAGILVTRSASKTDLGDDLGRQLLTYPRALGVLSVMLVFMSMIPGMPIVPFILMAVGAGYAARTIKQKEVAIALDSKAAGNSDAAPVAGANNDAKPASPNDEIEALLKLDTLQVELGYGLVSMADARKGGDLLKRVTGIRRTFAQEMGVLVPPIRLKDNLQMAGSEYRVLLKGNEVAKGDLQPGQWLAMNATESTFKPAGVPTIEPVFNLPAVWISDVHRQECERNGYTVVDAPSVLVTHLSETIKKRCHEILTRQDVQKLLDNLKDTHAAVVSELIPEKLNVGHVQRVLQNLLAEGISIRNLPGILEKLSDHADVTKNPDDLSEFARTALGPALSRPFETEMGGMQAITFDPVFEQELARGLRQSANEVTLAVEPGMAEHLVSNLSTAVKNMITAGRPPLLLCAPQLRLAIRRFLASSFNELAVLAYSEIPPQIEVQRAAIISNQ
jgi:flagellar biosynthesis protein FlhA